MEEEKDPTQDEIIAPEAKRMSEDEQYKAAQEFATHKIRQREADSAKVVMKTKSDPKLEPVKDPDCHKSKMPDGYHSWSSQKQSKRGYLMRFCFLCNALEFYTSVDKKPVSWIPKAIVDKYEQNKD